MTADAPAAPAPPPPGVVTGKGLMRLVREGDGGRVATAVLAALLIANVGTICAEFAGLAAGMEVLSGTSRYVSGALGALAVSVLVLRGSFRRVEHVLLALGAIFAAYVVSGFLAGPDRAATGRGLVVPTVPHSREAVLGSWPRW
jgi:Mn2+/Fe2+ NRAMP family transporter